MPMETRALRLQVGTPLQITFVSDERQVRHYVQLIGYVAERSLVVSAPHLEGKAMLVREGQLLVVRLLAGNTVLGFTSEVLRSCSRPYPYLHVAYPREMAEIVVRKALRVGVNLIASVYNESADPEHTKPISAVITDISTSGAQLVVSEQLGQADEMLTVQARFAVGAVQEYLTLPAAVRSFASLEAEGEGEANGPRWRYGIEFQILEQSDAMVVHGFVYEQIIRTMTA